MKIQVETLSEGTHEFNFVVLPNEIFVEDDEFTTDELAEDLEKFVLPILVSARVEKNPRQTHLRVKISTSHNAICDRCTETFENPIVGEYEMVYGYEQRNTMEMEEMDFSILDNDHPIIEMHDDVRQTLLLSIPMKLLCKDECRGLCSHCGKNLNTGSCTCSETAIDERWNTLLSLNQ
ncbi:MAG: DUF177 domain-containing protein [Ignavibacteriales bacterium]|nr:DUF177 domain-containing protein [Ignavibacteriales bacterium]